jgi:light-regulated signal transduction histidine kinase (bacteriophytochrome)
MDGHSDIDLNDIIENQKGQIDDLTLKLEIMTKVVDSLSYSISHDLKAPLRAINGFSRLIFEEYESKLDLEGKHFLNSILRNAKYMGLQIDDLLRYSRASSDPLYMENIDTIQLINEIIAIYKKENEDRNISIEIEALPDIFGDKAMFYNVFNNILSNAFKFTRDKELTEIKIGCICGSDKNIYYFQDNGIGFNMKYSGKLFGIFQRLHTEEEFEGLGSGLAIVQRIIQRHGGETSIEAEINKGATFKIHLPINQA